jgi:predicted nucleic acid-binding protein
MGDVFLDTSFAIALAVASDRHHERVVQLADQIIQSQDG